MKKREAIEQWIKKLGIDMGATDNIETFGDRKFKFSIFLLNQDGNYLRLRKGAIHELVVEDDIMNWFHRG